MKIIYDFDGTLTPYGLPQYKVLKQFGYDDSKIMERINKEVKEKGTSLYEAYYSVYDQILAENNSSATSENILLGCNDVEFNNGVLDFFSTFATKENKITNYVVTSGIEEYVKNTKIAPYIEEIYGVQYEIIDGVYTKRNYILDADEKPNIIKKILDGCKDETVIYVGDGLTDAKAFEYTKSIGGYTIIVGSTSKDEETFEELKKIGIVDTYCVRDYSDNSDIRKTISSIKKGRVNNVKS